MDQLLHIPAQLEEILRRDAIYEDLAKALFRSTDFLYLGRGIHFPIALEGALKLKEISYIHAEGYPAGEMKHGPNALIDENLPTVVLATRDPSDEMSRVLYEKTLSNIQEVKAREGIVVAVACEGDEEVRQGGRPRDSDRRDARSAAADSRSGAAAIAGVSHRGAARMRCGSAAESGQERYGRIMTDWKKTAAALDPPIPEADMEKLLPVMEALEAAFRPLQATLTAESDVWTGPEDVA